MIDGSNDGDATSPLLPWQHCVQQLRFLRKPQTEIIVSVRRYFTDLSPLDIDEFIQDTPMPTAWITTKNSSVTSEDLIQCIQTMMIEINPVSETRGLLLGVYLHMIGECQRSKSKELVAIGKEHLALFKKLDL